MVQTFEGTITEVRHVRNHVQNAQKKIILR